MNFTKPIMIVLVMYVLLITLIVLSMRLSIETSIEEHEKTIPKLLEIAKIACSCHDGLQAFNSNPNVTVAICKDTFHIVNPQHFIMLCGKKIKE